MIIPTKFTVMLTEDERKELRDHWDMWEDQSFAIHAAYIFRKKIEEFQRKKEEEV